MLVMPPTADSFSHPSLANADALGHKGDVTAAADVETGTLTAATPVITEAKSRWLASRLSRMVHLQSAARSSVESHAQPEAAGNTADPAAEVGTSADAMRRSVEMPVLQHSSDSAKGMRGQRTSVQEAVMHGATRSERIDALTEHPAEGVDGSEAAQPVALISAVQTEDGRLVVDSVAAGDSAPRREEEETSRAAASPTAAAIGGISTTQQQAGEHADDVLGSSTADTSDVAPPHRRGILQRLRLRLQPSVVSAAVLPADVP